MNTEGRAAAAASLRRADGEDTRPDVLAQQAEKAATLAAPTVAPILALLAPALVDVVRHTSQVEIETAKIHADADKEARRLTLEHFREINKLRIEEIKGEQAEQRGRRRHLLLVTLVAAVLALGVIATMLYLLFLGRREDAQVLVAFIGGSGFGSLGALLAGRFLRARKDPTNQTAPQLGPADPGEETRP